MKKKTSTLLPLILALAACSNSDFSSKDKKGSETVPVPQETPQVGVRNPNKETFPTNPNGGGGGTVDICQSSSFKVLILDLKSGWFAGDGGDLFKEFTAHKCEDKVKISYLHITRTFAEGNFEHFSDYAQVLPCLANTTKNTKGQLEFTKGESNELCQLASITSYDQLWVLSGSEADSYDIKISKPFFQSIKARALELKAANPKSGFFFGAGLGNAGHANSLAVTLFPKFFTEKDVAHSKPFSESMLGDNTDVGVFPNPKQMIEEFAHAALIPGDGKTPGTFKSDDAVFPNKTSLFDYKKTADLRMTPADNSYTKQFKLGECFTNPIFSTKATALATDACGSVAVAKGNDDEHKIFLEGNLGRFYGTAPAEYFHSIILQLLP